MLKLGKDDIDWINFIAFSSIYTIVLQTGFKSVSSRFSAAVWKPLSVNDVVWSNWFKC